MGKMYFSLGQAQQESVDSTIRVNVKGRRAEAIFRELITSGSRGISTDFAFSTEWNDLRKIVVFQAGDRKVDFELSGDSCEVPPEVMEVPREYLRIGVYGVDGAGNVVIPTVYASVCRIEQGTEPDGTPPSEHTKTLIERLLDAAEAAQKTAESVRDDAEAGAFDGAPGTPGADGENGNIIWWTTAKVLADGDNATTVRRRLNGPDGLTPAAGDYVFGPSIGTEGDPTTLYVIITVSIYVTMTALGSIVGSDGFAPEVTIEQIEGGHRVTITSAAHPEGQSFDVMDGSGGSVTVDDEISGSSENPVQNKVIKAALDEKANISSVPTKTSDLQNDSGFLTKHQSLAAYRTAAAQDVIDAGKGTYSKPARGIPATDLASAVQTSLGKADTALQPGDVDEPFVVTYTAASGATATCDKTYAQIMVALQAKQEVLAFYVASNSVAAQLTTVAIDTNNSDILFTNAQNGGVTTLRHNSAGTITVSSNDGYVFRDQGIANAGKFLVVGSDGNVTAITLAVWQGGNY